MGSVTDELLDDICWVSGFADTYMWTLLEGICAQLLSEQGSESKKRLLEFSTSHRGHHSALPYVCSLGLLQQELTRNV
jgi:transcription elongation factor GreA-like protein